MFSTKFLTLYKYFKKLSTFGRNISQICLHNEVRQALIDEQAVVALESTIITHGMKFDYNIKTAREVERIIREQGAVPATIAILNGEIKVGLTEIELEELAQKQQDCYKISRRDFPYIISHKLTGGTTVSGTMIIAHKVGIPIFVTGGIGGVHREGETTMDISADLTELGRTPVAVFCSGVKSILDIGKTLEYLETQGVAVATYGPSKVFPEFFCRGTKFFSPYNLETDKAAAQFIETIFDMKLNSGLLIGVPIPDKYSLNERMISSAIEEGLQMAKKSDIRGKNVTPFLLSKVSEITEGKSLEANIALIKNNALVGARVAVEHAKLKRDNKKNGCLVPCNIGSSSDISKNRCEVNSDVNKVDEHSKIIVVGAINLDFVVNVSQSIFRMDGRTFKGKIAQAGGGVGRNIADALGKLGTSPFLISAVGNDEFGNFIMTQTIPHLNPNGISRLRDVNTGTCMVLCDHTGECLFVVGDMDIHERITEDQIKRFEKTIAESSLVVLDGNLSQQTLEFVLILCQKHSVPAWYEPTDYFRAHKPFLKSSVPQPNFISPNIQEFFKIYETIFKREAKPDESNIVQSCVAKGYEMSDLIDNIIITLGKEGVLIIRKGDSSDPFFTNSIKPRYIKREGSVTHRVYLPELVTESDIVNVSGAGDCFVSGFVAAMLRGESEKSCIKLGFKCSAASLKCFKPVPSNFSET